LSEVLGLQVAEGGAVVPQPDAEVGRAVFRALGFVGGGDGAGRVGRFQQALKKRPVGVLGRIAAGVSALEVAQVIAEGVGLGWHGLDAGKPSAFRQGRKIICHTAPAAAAREWILSNLSNPSNLPNAANRVLPPLLVSCYFPIQS
jgi:hypothetical protein